MNSSNELEPKNIAIESLINKLKEFFKDKTVEDLDTIFGSALSGIREYTKKGLPDDKDSEEFKKGVSLFANPEKRSPKEKFNQDSLAFVDVYETLRENNLDLFKICVRKLPEILQNLRNEMDAMEIDTDDAHQKNYRIVKDYVTQLETLVATDIKSLEFSHALGRKK